MPGLQSLHFTFLFSLLFSVGSSVCLAENWAQFRGPNFNGSTEESNLPSEFSPTKNVVWKTDLPGASAAVPIVWGDKVFVSSTNAEDESLLAVCVDRKTGDILWRKKVADGVRRDSRSNFAAPTPATDGKVVVFFYGNGPMVAYDYDGNEVWRKSITKEYGEFAFLWTFSTSPLIYEGKLYLQVLQRDTDVRGRGFTDKTNDSYLLALNPATGEEIFRTIRSSKARSESREAFTSPVPFEHDGRKEILIAGGDAISGHDPETGEEIWRWGTWNPERIVHWRLVPSPVAGEGIILACAPKKEPIYAIKAGGEGDLSNDANAIAWTSVDPRVVSSDVPTPAFAYGDFFILNKDRKMLARVEPKTGKIKWKERIPGTDPIESSPLVADGKIYFMNFKSRVFVYDAETGKKLSDVSLDHPEVEYTKDDHARSAVVASHGQLFVRTPAKLYCFAQE